MIKCFLSHSSKDKDFYVRVVAKYLKKEVKVFDEETFEDGMSPLEEIINGLDQSSLFVIFISNAALESEWVKNEMDRAKLLLDSSKIERIYPIIIEPGITYNDKRIPEWMRKSFNIQPILKPTIAARKINARLTEISWVFHPRLRERKEIFVGRNDLVNEIEERLDDFEKPTPIILVCSGLASIGRKSLIEHALRKGNLVRDSFEFPIISLNPLDGIEDFILKADDLGLFKIDGLKERLAGRFEDKLAIAKEMAAQAVAEGERLLIEDRGVIIQDNGEIVDWFADIVSAISESGHLTFGIASKYRLRPSVSRLNPLFFSVPVREMEEKERNGLLKRYAEFRELRLSKEELQFFSDLLSGYPEQVLFSIDLIADNGVHDAKRHSHSIQQYGSDKAKVVLDGLKDDQDLMDFVHFLSRFEFISYDVLFDIVDESKVSKILEKLLVTSVCEKIGRSGTYIRVNEVIRDYLNRNRYKLPQSYEDAMGRHVAKFVSSYRDENYDISDYIFSAQESLKAGNGFPDDLIVPSVFIKTIKRLYDEDKDYSEAIALADRVLAKERYLHKNTSAHLRYVKCQCLARQHNPDFFAEVRKVAEPDRSFLHGFYYRLTGNFAKAEEALAPLISGSRRDPRVIGELVLVYMQSEEFDLAFDLAKENYDSRVANPINANNYFACLILKEKSEENRRELEKIIATLALDPSDRAQEMVASMQARIKAYYDEDEFGSMQIIDEAISRYGRVAYPVLTKADLAAYFKNVENLKQAVELLERSGSRKTQGYRTFVRYKAILLALQGNLSQAKQLVNKELRGLIPSALERLNERLEYLAAKPF
ncbi:TIR domain-containing protein [Burkholderia cepacia]|nr:TIR domain-containing protein [Burkholderia cepacia]